MSSAHIKFDEKHCAGHALCAASAPDVFDLDDDGYCVPPTGNVSAELVEQARRGADACPERALEVVDDRGEGPGVQ